MTNRKKNVKLLFYEDAADGTVSVERVGPDVPASEIVLRVSGKPDASNHGDLSTQLLLGHLPMLLRPESKDAFAFGLGAESPPALCSATARSFDRGGELRAGLFGLRSCSRPGIAES